MDALLKSIMRKSLDFIPCRAQTRVYSASLGKYNRSTASLLYLEYADMVKQ